MTVRDPRATRWQHERLRRLTGALAGCEGLDVKLAEYSHDEARIDDLIAELEMAAALRAVTGERPMFQAKDQHDLRLPGVDCTIEVQHKLSVSAHQRVFYPRRPDIVEFARSPHEWQQRAVALQCALSRCAVDVQPQLGAELLTPRWDRRHRSEQENLCGDVALWLAEQLAAGRNEPRELRHKNARFRVTPNEQRRGRMLQNEPWRAFEIHTHSNGTGHSMPEWFEQAVRKKAKHSDRNGKLHVVGLVIEEAYAAPGDVLCKALLGGVVYDGFARREGLKLFRQVPIGGAESIARARSLGRDALLELAQYDEARPERGSQGIFFESPIRELVDGVAALFYCGTFQFIPNPFTPKQAEPLWALFPRRLDPWQLPSGWNGRGVL